MLTLPQAIIFGLLQGVTELFPISSLGHSVVLPRLLGWQVNQHAPFFLIFLVATHAATATVLFLFYFNDWKRILTSMAHSLKNRELKEGDVDAKLGWLLVIGTIPAGVFGLILETPLQTLFANPRLVAFVLILNGCMLFIAERLRKNGKSTLNAEEITSISWKQAVKIGIFQSIALIPGFSRTGATLTGGLAIGLTHADAARFSFLLATPIIAAAALLKLPELLDQAQQVYILPTIVGAITAGIGAYFSIRFLTRYFQTNTLTPFAVYCVFIGVILSTLFLFF